MIIAHEINVQNFRAGFDCFQHFLDDPQSFQVDLQVDLASLNGS